MNDTEIRALCHQFLDAIERGDYDRIKQLYHPEFKFWINTSGKEMSAEESLSTLRKGSSVHRRRTYDDRIINTFDGGFLARYSVNVVQHSGQHSSLWAALVAECQHGQILRLDEYLDSGKFSRGAQKG